MTCYVQMIRAVSGTQGTQEFKARQSVPVPVVIVSMAAAKEVQSESYTEEAGANIEGTGGSTGEEGRELWVGKEDINTLNTQPLPEESPCEIFVSYGSIQNPNQKRRCYNCRSP